MSKDAWMTLRVALVCAVVVSVIYGNAQTIDWDEFTKSAQIVGGILAIVGFPKLKGLLGGKVEVTHTDSNDDDDGVSDGS